MKTRNEEKIKVLLAAIEYIKNGTVFTGICDGLNFSCGNLPSDPKFYGITLPPRKYEYCDYFMFSFPLTENGRKQRIAFIHKAIKKLRK